MLLHNNILQRKALHESVYFRYLGHKTNKVILVWLFDNYVEILEKLALLVVK